MYPCPNCRARLRFDIPKQLLVCDHCDSSFNPYTIGREKDAVEHETFQTTVFTCPQCGGELICEDETAATFCSYCGSPTVLDSRISEERRPEYIVTFKKTKEEVKQSYLKTVKRAIYAPSEFKDPERIEKFRGIYMPYWSYDFDTDSDVSFIAKSSRRSGDYIIEDEYRYSGRVTGTADDITFDATSTYADDLSMAVAPFNIKQRQDFTPSILSGFYADTCDVDKALYADDAANMVARYNQTKVLASDGVRGKTVSSTEMERLKEQVEPKIKSAGLAFLPIWFLSYKTKDNRVAYSVVNGQTGKIVTDLPVDKEKFLLFSGITAVVLFLLFNFIFTLTPANLLFVALVFSFIILIIGSVQRSAIRKRETYEDDQGMLFKQKLEEMKAQENADIPTDMFTNASDAEKNDYVRGHNLALRCATAINSGVFKTNKKANTKKGDKKGLFVTVILPIAVIALSVLILIADPADDAFYYGSAIFCIAVLIITEFDLINKYNLLTTRKPPQLGRRGGDENA